MNVGHAREQVAEDLMRRLPEASDINAPAIVRELRQVLDQIEARQSRAEEPAGLKLVGAG